MEMELENKKGSACREILHQIKQIQESAESVVPDVNEDVGRIASVQTAVYLKSKDVGAGCVTITGELCATILYITEQENAVNWLKLSRNFRMDFESADISPESLARIQLQVSNVEARILNPRKLSLLFEITGELSAYLTEDLSVETLLPTEKSHGLQWKVETLDSMLPKAVCEKTMAIHEQFSFPQGKPKPSQLIAHNAAIRMTDTQLVGSKLIVKGTAEISLVYRTEECSYPVCTAFSTPFSQLVDVGIEELVHSSIHAELSSAYFELAENISGDAVLDAELHVVLQLLCCQKQQVVYLADAFSNRMPVLLQERRCRLTDFAAPVTEMLSIDQRMELPEDCEDVLCIFTRLSQCAVNPDSMRASVVLDVLYRSREGSFAVHHRSLNAEKLCPGEGLRLLDCSIRENKMRPDGLSLLVQLELEFIAQKQEAVEYIDFTSLRLCEDEAYDISSLPSLRFVRREERSLWELAKCCHSSREKILACNGEEESWGSFLLIPKEC